MIFGFIDIGRSAEIIENKPGRSIAFYCNVTNPDYMPVQSLFLQVKLCAIHYRLVRAFIVLIGCILPLVLFPGLPIWLDAYLQMPRRRTPPLEGSLGSRRWTTTEKRSQRSPWTFDPASSYRGRCRSLPVRATIRRRPGAAAQPEKRHPRRDRPCVSAYPCINLPI